MQEIDHDELVKKLMQLNYWKRIHENKLAYTLRESKPARIVTGFSQIITYYDENNAYLCTLHRVIALDNSIVHEDIKDACINQVRYIAVKKKFV